MVSSVPTSGARDLLGEIVTWDMGALEIPYARVMEALAEAGLPQESAAELRKQTAFARAVKDLRAGRAIDKVSADKDAGVISFQFTTKTLAEAHLDFTFEAIATLDTNTGEITCEDSPEIEAHARTMFAHALAHRNTSDVTRLVQRLFERHADLYPINPRKGVAYFVPEAHRGFSGQVEDFLAALGGRLLRFPVPRGTPEGNRAVKHSVEEGLRALSQELEEAVDDWTESTREATMQHAIERWQVIKHKCEAYSEYLGDRQEALLATLAAQRARLAAKVAQVTAAKDAATHGDAEGQQTIFPTAEPPADFPTHAEELAQATA